MQSSKKFIAFASVACIVSVTAPVAAQDVLTKKRLSAALAMEAVTRAVEACQKAGYAVTAVLVDDSGVRQALLRGDNATIHTRDSAYAKAYTAVSFASIRRDDSTMALAERIAKANGGSTKGLSTWPNITYTAGGITIRVGDEVVGGIGVGGAPGGNFDHDCAAAGLDAIKDRLK